METPRQPADTAAPKEPGSKLKLLVSSLGVTTLISAVYLPLSYLAHWLPEAYGEQFLEWAGPLEGLPAEGVWAVQSIFFRILICGLGLFLVYGLARLFYGQKLRLPFARLNGEQRSTMYENIVVYFVILIGIQLLFSFTGWGSHVEGSAAESVQVGLLGHFMLFSFIVLAGPFFEEVLFRGFLYKKLRLAFSFWPAFLISGLFFSVLHFNPQESLNYNLYGIGSVLLFSYFVTKTFEATDNLWTAFIFHGLYNGWLMFWLFVIDAAGALSPV